jgi:hypothetical protein
MAVQNACQPFVTIVCAYPSGNYAQNGTRRCRYEILDLQTLVPALLRRVSRLFLRLRNEEEAYRCIEDSGVERDRFGRIAVDELMKVKGVSNVFAAGDVGRRRGECFRCFRVDTG